MEMEFHNCFRFNFHNQNLTPSIYRLSSTMQHLYIFSTFLCQKLGVFNMALSAVFLLVSLLAVPAVYAVDHTVGGTSGWNLGVNFAAWAAGEKFAVGDNLIFTYTSSSHSVEEISKSNYDSCTAGKAINSYTGGQNTVPLNKSGPIYFLCPSIGHCGGGMKLSITVAAASTPATPTPTTPATPTPTTPATPTPTTPATPPKADTPPTTPESPSPPKDSPSTPKDNGAVGGFGDMNKLVVGVSIVFAGLMGFLG